MQNFPKYSAKIAENMKRSSQDCFNNGVELLNESYLLHDNRCYARATSLAILAEEEFSKSLVLHISSIEGKWDEQLYKSLRNHEIKHAISGGLAGFMKVFCQYFENQKYSFLPLSFDFEKHVSEEVVKAQNVYIKRQRKDKKKQDAQFVAIDKTGVACRIPNSFTYNDAATEIDSARKCKAYIDAIHHNIDDSCPLFRFATTLTVSGSDVEIRHKSGVTVRFKSFGWADSGGEPNKAIMNPHIILPTLGSLDPNKLSSEQKINLAKIYKAYDAPKQILKEMQTIGLRGTAYLDEVETLIRDFAT